MLLTLFLIFKSHKNVHFWSFLVLFWTKVRRDSSWGFALFFYFYTSEGPRKVLSWPTFRGRIGIKISQKHRHSCMQECLCFLAKSIGIPGTRNAYAFDKIRRYSSMKNHEKHRHSCMQVWLLNFTKSIGIPAYRNGY